MKQGQHGIIITGGRIDEETAVRVLRRNGISLSGRTISGEEVSSSGTLSPNLIAADRGLDFCRTHGILPGHILGDFDSADAAALAFFREMKDIDLKIYPPEKDWTDTELAVRLGISLGWKKITVLGGTGTRLDHVLGNLQSMELALEEGVQVMLIDAHNRVRMIREDLLIPAEELYGTYISLIPWGGPAAHVTLRGLKYELTDRTLETRFSVGISNQSEGGTVQIRLRGGKLIVVESTD